MEARKTPRFWMAVQPTIIRLYKAAGLVALTAILVGLIGFLIVNIFYFFDHTWVRPVVITQHSQKYLDAKNALTDAKRRESELSSEQIDIQAKLAEIDRTIAADEAFIKEVGTSVDAPRAPEQWLLKRKLEEAILDKDNQAGRRAPLHARLESVGLLIKEQETVVKGLEESPYLRASGGKVVFAFVPYENLPNVKQGVKLYGCSWGLVLCHTVGRVKNTIPGEVQDIHPHDESVRRGIMVEIELTTPSAEGESVLFLGSKPLWLF